MTARKARQARSRNAANRIILAGLVVVVLAAIYGLVGVLKPVTISAAAPASQSTKLEVTSDRVGCPAPGSAGVTGGPIAIANLPARAGTGQTVMTRLDVGTAGTAIGKTPRPGQLTVVPIKPSPPVPKKLDTTTKMAGGAVPTGPARGGLAISTTDANAQGLDVEQLGPGGQPTARCERAGSDFWFVGPGSPKYHIELYLMNVDDEPADAAVAVQTDSGQTLGPQDSGIVVPPHRMVVQTMDKLVHAAKAIAFHVTTSTGRVVAAVRITNSLSREGTWLPPTETPATTQVLTGLPASPGARELYVTVPGGAATTVKVTVVTQRGTYQPTGGTENLLGHQTTGLSIPSVASLTGSIEISASVPVTAVLEMPGGPSGAPGSFIIGGGPIVGQGVVAANTSGKVGTCDLVLSAPGAAASVSVALAAPGEALTGLNGQIVKIKAKSAVQVKLALPKQARKVPLIAVVVTPLSGSGPVYGGRVAVIRGSIQTVIPVITSPSSITLDQVDESLTTVLGNLSGPAIKSQETLSHRPRSRGR
ncbi:MAG TPA: DUF5719 family protein [Streptosporangiaceae bacterium]|nr:DUF5719 family protein [Streptosporangiaceae bacterium]